MRQWTWIGRLTTFAILIVVIVYMNSVGLNTASMLGGAVSGVAALASLVAPYLWPSRPLVQDRQAPLCHHIQNTGDAKAINGGTAVTGSLMIDDRQPLLVDQSGDAYAYGPGSVAVTGILGRSIDEHDR